VVVAPPTGTGGTTTLPQSDFSVPWAVNSGGVGSSRRTYNRAGFNFRIQDDPVLNLWSTPSGEGVGTYGGAGGYCFSDGSCLQWGSTWRNSNNYRRWYFVWFYTAP
jgi:hypothetical protein